MQEVCIQTEAEFFVLVGRWAYFGGLVLPVLEDEGVGYRALQSWLQSRCVQPIALAEVGLFGL